MVNIADNSTKTITALAISTVYTVFPDVFKAEKSIHTTKETLRMYFKKRGNTYDITLNNETFLEDISADEIKTGENNIIEAIQKKVTPQTKIIELFLEPELFTLGINEWKFKNLKLSQKYTVIFRSIILKDSGDELKQRWTERWKENFEKHEDNPFEDSMCLIENEDCFDSSIVSAVFTKETLDGEDFEILAEAYISVALWKNQMNTDVEQYKEFLTIFQKHNFEKVKDTFKECVKTYPRDICLMWDDPTTLPKKDLH